jgi:hypothetical protein
MAFIEDGATTKTEATRDTVFLIGDSIKGCYAPFVKEELADIAEVVYPTDNCRNTQYVLVSLNNWLNICNPECVKVVQFNCGHWDVAHWSGEERSLNTVEVYADNIKRIIKRLKTVFPNAKIVFATTTAMNPTYTTCTNPRSNEEIAVFNKAAVAACGDDAYINDLFTLSVKYGPEFYQDYCHFNEKGSRDLAQHIALFLRELV